MFALLSVFLKELKNNFNLKKFVFLTCECQRIPFQPMPSDVGGKNPELKKVGTTDYSLIMETKFQEMVKNYFEQVELGTDSNAVPNPTNGNVAFEY
jgi:hypothetical protein